MPPRCEIPSTRSFSRSWTRKACALRPQADRRTLVRRAYFDLHGLPPTPEQVEQFVNDKSPDAYEKLIDRLLASPRYGERWGRYWLDLVRYADTSGFETDHFFTTAWRYRDYVINSFNTDKPYNTFVQEQIAADELWSTNMDLEGTSKLPKEKEENVNRRIGTSLFTLGSFPIEFTYYGDQFRAEWQADAVDTVGAAFLGLTVGCARCHDHKFDPISQRDYYRMTALFAGSVEREIPLVSLFDVQTNTRNFPLLAQAQVLKRWRAVARTRAARRSAAATAEPGEDAWTAMPRLQRAQRHGSAARRAAAAARRSLPAGAGAISHGECAGARRSRSRHAHSDPGRFQEQRRKSGARLSVGSESGSADQRAEGRTCSFRSAARLSRCG